MPAATDGNAKLYTSRVTSAMPMRFRAKKNG
jgi:hypothetical protein